MSAENLTGYGSGRRRTNLVEQLPMQTPFVIDLLPIYACNFQCNYCIYSFPKECRGLNYSTDIMSIDTFKKIVADVCEFDDKLKMFRFTGNGESLLHPDIDKMVAYVSESKIADNIEIITNGSLLTPDMSDRLVDAGLTQIRISLQGLCAEDYQNTSHVKIDFEKFVSNIEYLFNHKKNLYINLKIMNCSIDSEEKEKKLWEIFGNIADSISVEEISPLSSKIDYTAYGFDTNKIVNEDIISMRGTILPKNIHICNHPFYLMMINPDGTVLPCCSFEVPPCVGNVMHEKLTDIWNGEMFNAFRRNMLKGVKYCGKTCENCKGFLYNMFPEDIITDEDAKYLITKY